MRHKNASVHSGLHHCVSKLAQYSLTINFRLHERLYGPFMETVFVASPPEKEKEGTLLVQMEEKRKRGNSIRGGWSYFYSLPCTPSRTKAWRRSEGKGKRAHRIHKKAEKKGQGRKAPLSLGNRFR